ncbi:MAG: PhoH family protein, partial [Calditrichaeota bacterium]|nr:PhoH family protein [Calditrichota bacterium]
QMKMFLTRMGENSKAVITGDLTQIDLPRRSDSGLLGIQYILDGIAGIEFVKLNKSDVVRHPLVARIVGAYDRFLQDSASASGDAANETGEDLGKLPEHRSKPSSAND